MRCIARTRREAEASKRKENITIFSIFALPIFEKYSNYIDGTIISVNNNNPVIFNAKTKRIVKGSIKKLREMYTEYTYKYPDHKFSYRILFNAIDLFYRLYEIVSFDILNFCLIISMKTLGKFPDDELFDEDDTEAESEIVKLLKGYLSRDLVISYLDTDQYETFLDWLQENPDRYEQCSLKKLAEITRSLSV